MSAVGVGFTLQPDLAFLSRCAPLIARADYLEVAPETTWRARGGELAPNGYHRRFLELGSRFVAHGVGYSMGSVGGGEAERARRDAWRGQIDLDQRDFAFRWYTDHLGATSLGGEAVTLPVPLPMTRARAAVLRGRLRELQRVVPDVGLENSVFHGLFGDPLEEARWLSEEVLVEPGHHLLLDVHNVWVASQNFGFDPDAWLARVDLGRVIEIHVAGGCESDPAWLPEGRTVRLDAHDSAVPEPVWGLLDRWAARCPNLRGITLERMEGTVEERDVDGLIDELERVRAVARGLRPTHPEVQTHPEVAAGAASAMGGDRAVGSAVEGARDAGARDGGTGPRGVEKGGVPGGARDEASWEAEFAAGLRATPPFDPDGALDPDGLQITALLIARLRFERLVQGSVEADAWFERAPERFAAAFRRYHAEVPMTAFFPPEEAVAFARWRAARGDRETTR